MEKKSLAMAAVFCVLLFVLSSCSMEFSPGASALLGSTGEKITSGTTQALPDTTNPLTTAASDETTADVTGQETTLQEEGTGSETRATEPEETAKPVTPENFKCRQLDILTSGSFYVKCDRFVENEDVTTMIIANTPNSVYMSMTVSNVPLGILMADDTMYMMYEQEKKYIELNDVTLKIIGIDPKEMKIDTIGAIQGAVPYACEETVYTDGEPATVAKFTDGVVENKIYTRGDTLLEMDTIGGESGSSRLVFSLITDDIPADKRSITSEYEKIGMWSFFKLLSQNMAVE